MQYNTKQKAKENKGVQFTWGTPLLLAVASSSHPSWSPRAHDYEQELGKWTKREERRGPVNPNTASFHLGLTKYF